MKALGIILPIFLFLFKYIIPGLAETLYSKEKKNEKKQILIELMHFPVDLLFVAISYFIPKIIDLVSQIALNGATEDIKGLVIRLVISSISSVLLFILMPFCVLLTKIADNCYFKDNKRIVRIILYPSYIISIVFIVVSIFI